MKSHCRQTPRFSPNPHWACSTRHPTRDRSGARGDPSTRAACARVTCGVSARSRRAQGRGRAEAAAQARPDSRALGGRRGAPSRSAAALASLRASPAGCPKRTGQRGDYYPIIAPGTVATMRAGNRKAESPAPRLLLRASPVPTWEHESGRSDARGRSDPEGAREEGHASRSPAGVAALGEARRARLSSPGPLARPAPRPEPGRAGKGAGATRPPPRVR